MKGKLRKILGLAVSAAMAVSAVVPWTGMTAFAADGEVVNQLRIVISDELAEKVDVNGGPAIPSNERFLHAIHLDPSNLDGAGGVLESDADLTVPTSLERIGGAWYTKIGALERYASYFEVDSITTENYDKTFNGITLLTYNTKDENPYLSWEDVRIEEKLEEGYIAAEAEWGNILTLTLYPKEEESITYTLEYNVNGGEGTIVATTGTSTIGSCELTVTSEKPSRAGHIFNGWAENEDGTGTVYQGGSTIVLEAGAPSKTLYAVWEKDGGGEPVEKNYPYEVEVYVDGAKVDDKGWAVAENGTDSAEITLPVIDNAIFSNATLNDADILKNGWNSLTVKGLVANGPNVIKLYYTTDSTVPAVNYPYEVEVYVDGTEVQDKGWKVDTNGTDSAEITLPVIDNAIFSNATLNEVDILKNGWNSLTVKGLLQGQTNTICLYYQSNVPDVYHIMNTDDVLNKIFNAGKENVSEITQVQLGASSGGTTDVRDPDNGWSADRTYFSVDNITENQESLAYDEITSLTLRNLKSGVGITNLNIKVTPPQNGVSNVYVTYDLTYKENGGIYQTKPGLERGKMVGEAYPLNLETIPQHDPVNGKNVAFVGWGTTEDDTIYSRNDSMPNTITSVTVDADAENIDHKNLDILVYALWGYDEDSDGIADILENEITVFFNSDTRGAFADGSRLVEMKLTEGDENVAIPSIIAEQGYELDYWRLANNGEITFAPTDKLSYEWFAKRGLTGNISMIAIYKESTTENPGDGDGGNGNDGYSPWQPTDPSDNDNDNTTDITDPETPLAPGTGIDDGNTPSNPGAEDAVPGGPNSGPSDGDSAEEEEMNDEETPLSSGSDAVKTPPQTGRKAAGSLALLAGAAVVAAITLRKKDN